MPSNNTSNKKQNSNNKPIHRTKTKHNFITRLIIKRLISKAKKNVRKYREKAEFNLQERQKTENALLEMSKIFNITNEKNEEINQQNIKQIPEEELLEITEQAIELLKKEV